MAGSQRRGDKARWKSGEKGLLRYYQNMINDYHERKRKGGHKLNVWASGG